MDDVQVKVEFDCSFCPGIKKLMTQSNSQYVYEKSISVKQFFLVLSINTSHNGFGCISVQKYPVCYDQQILQHKNIEGLFLSVIVYTNINITEITVDEGNNKIK